MILRAGQPTRSHQRHWLDAYAIEPFDPAQLPKFAQRWFEALGMADPADLAGRFMNSSNAAS